MNAIAQTETIYTEEMSQNNEMFDSTQWVLPAGERFKSCFEQSFNLLLVITGSVLLDSPYGQQEYQAGTLITLENVHFDVINTHASNDCLLLGISFSDKMMQRFKQRYATALINAKNKHRSEDINLPLNFYGCDLTRMAMTALAQLISTNADENLLALKLEELVLLQLTDEKAPQLAMQLLTSCDPATAKFRDFIEANFLNDWPLEQFAKEFAVSLTAFKSQFNQVYNTSPRAWINERRLRYADELLRTSKMRIIEIAITAGFSSQSYFTQAYKSRFGVTPTKAR